MRVMFNEDWIHFFWTRYENNIDVTEKTLKDFIYQYKDTAITDFAMNVNGTVSSFPSDVLESFTDKYYHEEENGYKVNYKTSFAKTAHDIFTVKGLDMYKLWIDALHEIGRKAWISFRINDCHADWEKFNVRKNSGIEKCRNLWRQSYREPDYFGKCLNYADERVRTLAYSYLKEALERYNPDGIELDFMRELLVFVPGGENRSVMTDFMKNVKVIVTEAEHRYGHKIPISVIAAPEPKTNYEAGLDIAAWAREGLIDSVCAIQRWETVTTNIPIEFWKSILGEVPFAAGQQLLVRGSREQESVMSNVDMAFGQAAAAASRGADFIYLYNYFDLTESGLNSVLHDTAMRPVPKEFLESAGDLAKLKTHSRRYPLTYDDCPNYWERVNCRLPIVFDGTLFETIRISAGDLSGDFVLLQLGCDEKLNEEDFEIYVNTKPVKPAKAVPDYNIYKKNWYAFLIESAGCEKHMTAEIKIKKSCKLEYAEIYAKSAE